MGLKNILTRKQTSIEEETAQREGIEENQILIGNGGAEIISLIGRLLAGKHVMIVEPAFSEYEQACKVNGCEISYFQLSRGLECGYRVIDKKAYQCGCLIFL